MATKTETMTTPSALAEKLNVDAKRIRAYLRANHARAIEAKNTSWQIPADVAKDVEAHFTPAPAKKGKES
jgi:hypothetical protein